MDGLVWPTVNADSGGISLESTTLKCAKLIVLSLYQNTVDPRFNEHLYNEVLETNDFLFPSNSKILKKNLDITKPRYSVQILSVPWPFVKWRFHGRRVQQPPKFIFIHEYITWQLRQQHQMKLTRKNSETQLQKNNLSFQNTERRSNIDQRYRLTKDYGPTEDNYTFAGFWRLLLRLDFFSCISFQRW